MLPSAVKTRTEKRLEHIALYGPQVFDECLLDPLKTLDVDIQPRFLRSPLYQEMLEMCSYIYETEAQPEELDTPVPEVPKMSRAATQHKWKNDSLQGKKAHSGGGLLNIISSGHAAGELITRRTEGEDDLHA
eukprot:scaffold561_cov254-Pinguiococcus_pyrenoidosus.AAC.8